MKVDGEAIEYIAALAKLKLRDDDREDLSAQLERVLDFIEQLDEVDVDDVPPTKHVIDQINVGREDVRRRSLSQGEALAGAPSADEGHFVVPKILPD